MSILISALIFYTSDNPEQFKYFTQQFTNQLNKSHVIEVLADPIIEKKFYQNFEKFFYTDKIESKLKKNIDILKKKIMDSEYEKAFQTSIGLIVKFNDDLKNFPQFINHHVLVEYYFWNSVSQLSKNNELLDKFIFLSNLSERSALLEQLPKNLKKRFISSVKSHQILLKNYEIQNAKNCKISLNGSFTPLNDAANYFIRAPINSVIGAECENGYFTKEIKNTENYIVVDPKIRSVFKIAPTLNTFPIKLLNSNKINTLIFMHWSSFDHKIQTTMTQSKNLAVKSTLILDLTTKESKQSAGDKIEQFIVSKSKSLIE